MLAKYPLRMAFNPFVADVGNLLPAVSVEGFGAEIAATIAQEAFMDLDAPVERLTTPVTPIPFNRNLMDAVLPTVERIRQRMEWLLGY